jgi:ribonuclease P protein component
VSDRSFPKSRRLLKSAEFERVFDARHSKADRLLIVYADANDVGHARLGLVVSRRVGNAVQRNRWKRCLREAFRTSREQLPPLDLVVLPKGAAPQSMEHVQQSLVTLAGRLAATLPKAPPIPRGERP